MKIIIPDNNLFNSAAAITAKLKAQGYVSYLAGGCVRDLMIGRTPSDIDIVTDAQPDAISALFPGSDLTGKSFGVIRTRIGKEEYEIATFRADDEYQDGRHPVSVRFADEKTDSSRRDFTINAMFLDPVDGRVIDYHGGAEDLKRKTVRFIGTPVDRIKEDHLRMLRALRFSALLGFSIDADSLSAIRDNAALISRISAERIRDELIQIFTRSASPGKALDALQGSLLLGYILPEISALKGLEQPPDKHPEGDVFTHTALMLDLMGLGNDHLLAFAVILHDVGKKTACCVTNGNITFPDHEKIGAKSSVNVLARLKFPNKDIKYISQCVERHGLLYHPERLPLCELRRIAGSDTFKTELRLHELDIKAAGSDDSTLRFYRDFIASFKNEPMLPSPLINGDDLIAAGCTAGPAIGSILKQSYDLQLDRKINSRGEMLDWLKKTSG